MCDNVYDVCKESLPVYPNNYIAVFHSFEVALMFARCHSREKLCYNHLPIVYSVFYYKKTA